MRPLTRAAVLAVVAVAPLAAQVRLVNVTPRALSAEWAQQAEPSIAVEPRARQQIAIAVMTDDHEFCGDRRAPMYVSRDGGLAWVLSCAVPLDGARTYPEDYSVRFGGGGTLFAAMLRSTDPLTLYVARTDRLLALEPMNVVFSHRNADGVDQPFLDIVRRGGVDHLVIAASDKDAPWNGTATLYVASDAVARPARAGGDTLRFRAFGIESRQIVGQNYAVRTA
jgi:hypothetical protein